MSAKFALYHPNAKGTGSALKITRILPLDEIGGKIYTDGVFRFELAPQRGGRLFDWDRSLSFCFDSIELASMLRVLRGESEALQDGKGVSVFDDDSPDHQMLVRFMHRIEPTQGYFLEVREPDESAVASGKYIGGFFFSPPEAMALELAIEQSLHLLVFGAPNI